MCAKTTKKASAKKSTVRIVPAKITITKNTGRKTTKSRFTANRTAESDYSDEEIEHNSNLSDSSDNELEEDFLSAQPSSEGQEQDEEDEENEEDEEDEEDLTPRRSVRETTHSSVEFTPRRSAPDSFQSNATYTPRRSVKSTINSSIGNQSQRQSLTHLAPRRSSKSTARPSTQNDSRAGPSRPEPSRANQRHSSPKPRERQRKQSNPRKRGAIKEIITLQRSYNLLIPLASFQRVVRETMLKFHDSFRIQIPALKALQEASEMYLVQLFEDAGLLVLHRSRVTLAPKDIKLVLQLRPRTDSGRP